MKVAIVKYDAGNVGSVSNALERLGVEPIITDDAATLLAADKVIFPGVGEASTAMAFLQERRLDTVIPALTQPVLGVCLGMQLLCESSEESDTTCLGIFPYRVRKFVGQSVKVPHIGWNTISEICSPLFDGPTRDQYFYFVHGYYVETGAQTTATCTYDTRFSAAVGCRNFHGVQFHPEKSGAAGQLILENFLRL